MRLRSGAFFFFTYDQSTYLFRWDPDLGFSVGGLRGAGDPLRPQAPQSEEQPKKCAYALERFFFHVRPIHIPVSLGSRPWIFRRRFAGGWRPPARPVAGGWRPPAPPGPTVKETGAQKAKMKGHEGQKGQKLQNAAGLAADKICLNLIRKRTFFGNL